MILLSRHSVFIDILRVLHAEKGNMIYVFAVRLIACLMDFAQHAGQKEKLIGIQNEARKNRRKANGFKVSEQWA